MKHLISFVGTGALNKENESAREYRTANYTIDNKEYKSSFVSTCLYDHLDNETMILIGTAKSMWEEVYRVFCKKFGKEINEDYYWKLVESCEKANYKTAIDSIDLSLLNATFEGKVKAIIIPYGLNRDEQIEIFRRISQELKSFNGGDEIILDITHSFRSLPLYVTACINYVNELLAMPLKTERTYYGMLDIRSEMEDGKVPIVDVSTTLELNEWATAAHSFKDYGKGYALAELVEEEVAKQIQEFTDVVSINYLSDIKSQLTNLQHLSKRQFKNEFAQMIVPEVVGDFVKKLHSAGTSQSQFQYQLAVWHYEHGNYSSAYLVFVESVITFVCEQSQGFEWNASKHRSEAKKFIVSNNRFGLRKIYGEANKIRKNIAHNLGRRSGKVSSDIDKFKKLSKEYYEIMQKQNPTKIL